MERIKPGVRTTPHRCSGPVTRVALLKRAAISWSAHHEVSSWLVSYSLGEDRDHRGCTRLHAGAPASKVASAEPARFERFTYRGQARAVATGRGQFRNPILPAIIQPTIIQIRPSRASAKTTIFGQLIVRALPRPASIPVQGPSEPGSNRQRGRSFRTGRPRRTYHL
jgi:hypothetical protein